MDLFKLFSGESSKSKNKAKERLKLILVDDRNNCSTEFLDLLKEDLLKVISGYIEVEENQVQIKVTRTIDGGKKLSALVANIPIKRLKNKQ